ncbi:DUF3857 domain-containing protein [Pontiellaceae bacterium B1224]|nr:DUF3857 domain-containing protein [Pontiellaceae bacterium B1224]
MLGYVIAVVETPTEYGQIFGNVFWIVMSIIGISKCFSIARRKSSSTLCVHSLTLTVVGFLLMQVLQILKAVLPAGLLHSVVTIGGAVLICLLTVVGVTLAIVGLSMYRRSFNDDGTRRQYKQGRKQAGWAIGLNCVFLSLFMVGLVGGMLGRTRLSAAQNLAKEIRETEYSMEELNFQLSLPNKNWMSLEPSTINEDSCLVLVRHNPEVYMAVIAECPGIEVGMTADQLVSISHANIKLRDPTAVFSEVDHSSIGTFEGRRYEVDASVGSMKMSYLFWCGVRNGYCYQLMFWSGRKNKEQVREQADQILEGFCQIDAEKRAYGSGGGPFGKHQSEEFGYAVDLRDSDWMAWNEIHASDFLADVGGLYPDGTRFTVVPMALPLEDAPPEMVQKAYLELYGFEEPLKEDQLESVTIQGMPAYVYSYSNGENDCVEQVVFATNLAYLVAVWRPAGQADGLDEAARKVFGSVVYNPPEFDFQSLENLSDDRRAAQGKMINRVGLGFYNAGRFPEAVDWFAAGLSCDATNALYFSNILSSHHRLGQQAEALALLDEVSAEIRETEIVKSWEATLLYGAGKVNEADAAYSALFEKGYRNDDDFMDWTRLRADNGMWDGLDVLFADYMEPNPGVGLQLHQLDLYYSKGDYEHVAELSRSFLERQGFSADIAYWLIDACQELGLYNEALEVSEQLIEKGYATVDAYLEKAYCEYQLKWYRESKTTLETALKLNPRNETTKEWLGILSAELGEGDNSLLKDSIDPVELPAALAEKVSGKPVPDFGKEFGAYYALHLTLWKYEQGGELKRTTLFEIKVLDDAGISSFSSLEYSFDPTSEEIFVNELEVLDTNGTVVARGAIKDFYVLDDDSDGLVSEDKKLVIPVPNLQPGYTIKAEVTRRYSSHADEFYFKRHFMAAGYPVLHSGVYLAGDVDAVTVRAFNGVEETRVENGVLWMGPGAYAYKWEPQQIPVERFVPGVALGGETNSWQACGMAYLEEIQEQLEMGKEPQEKAEELVAGCETAEEKYAAVMEWIRSSFTYKPLEFGRDAYIPDTAADTLSYRYGDCKDFAVLLKVMLEAVGVKCELVLANTGDDIYTEIFTTDQFNHMIAYLPEIRGGMFVDPTDQDADAFVSVPQGLNKQQVLVLDSEEPRLIKVPDYQPGSSSCTVRRVVSVNPGAPVGITEQVVLSGYYASWMRSALKDQQKVKWPEWFQQNVAYLIPGVQVQSMTAKHVTDPSEDLELNISYTQGHPLPTNLTEKVELDIQPLWAHYHLGVRSVQNRKNPFQVMFPLNMKITSDIVLADGMRLELQRPPADAAGDAFLNWSVNEQGVAEYSLKSGNFTAQEYSAYVDSMNRGIKAAHLRTKIIEAENKKELAKQ